MNNKKWYLFPVIALCLLIVFTWNTAKVNAGTGDVTINKTNFPDGVFRDYVSQNFDIDGDGILSLSESSNVLKINVSNKNISSLKGVEYFSSLKELRAANNKLKELIVNSNTALIYLDCSGNEISSLDLDDNERLETLRCSSNSNLTYLDVSGHKNLTNLVLFYDTKLREVICESCSLTNLNVENCTALTNLRCPYNSLTSLDVTSNIKLQYLNCYSNKLTALDVSENTALKELDCSDNPLTSLDISKNTLLLQLFCSNTSIKSLNTDGAASLEQLYIYNNALTQLDVSSNKELNFIECENNALTSLIIYDLPLLRILNVSRNAALTDLVCRNCALQSLNTENCPELQYINCSNNALTSLDVSSNAELYELSCDGNQLKTLNVSKNAELRLLYCQNNVLTNLNVSKNTLWELDCHNNKLTFLNITNSTELYSLSCYTNNIDLLDISSCHSLRDLYTNGKRSEKNGVYYYYPDDDGEESDAPNELLAIDKTTEITTEPIPATTITTQPKSVSATIGTTAKFTVAATGGGLKYQWQVSTDGSTWKNSSATGYNTKSISMKVTASKNGYRYRCVITNANGAKKTSSAAKLTVKTNITDQPVSVSAKIGATAEFTIAATGAGLKYRWQVSTDGNTWKNSSAAGYNTKSISMKVTASKNGYRYRCVITDANNVTTTSSAAKLLVKTSITSQPKSVSASAGTTVGFTVAATGAGLQYQWQYSTDGSSWKKSSATGYNTKTISLKATASKNGYRYRCVITDANGSKVTTSAAKLTVK